MAIQTAFSLTHIRRSLNLVIYSVFSIVVGARSLSLSLSAHTFFSFAVFVSQFFFVNVLFTDRHTFPRTARWFSPANLTWIGFMSLKYHIECCVFERKAISSNYTRVTMKHQIYVNIKRDELESNVCAHWRCCVHPNFFLGIHTNDSFFAGPKKNNNNKTKWDVFQFWISKKPDSFNLSAFFQCKSE